MYSAMYSKAPMSQYSLSLSAIVPGRATARATAHVMGRVVTCPPGVMLVAVCALGLVACTTRSPSQSVALPAVVTSVQTLPEVLLAAEQALAADRFPDAARWYEQAAQLTDDEQVIEEAATACYDSQQLKCALQIAQRWLVINPTSEQARELAALAALKLYNVEVATEQLQALLESSYISPAAGFMQWSDKFAAVDTNAALAVMKKLVISHPQVAEAQYALARLAEQSDDLGLMLASAQRAQALAPFWSPAGLLLAKAQLLRGEKQLAVQTAQAVVKNDDSIATRSEYAALLLGAQMPNEAMRLWRELEETEGDNSAAMRALAQIDFEVGNYQSAFNRFNQLLNTGRDLSESIYFLGAIAERTGANDEARQLYERVQEGRFAAAAQLRVAKLIQDKEGIAAALTSLQAYGAANPEQQLLSLDARAQMLSASGDDAATLQLYDRAIRDYPDVASLHLSRAFHLVKMNRTPLALQAMRDLAQQRPQDPTILNALGYTLLDNSKDYQRAHDYIAASLQYSPDSAAVQDSMGWALYKLGRKEEALTWLQRAAQGMVDDELDLHLGEVLWSLDRRDEARSVWQKALARTPDDKVLQQRLKRAGK